MTPIVMWGWREEQPTMRTGGKNIPPMVLAQVAGLAEFGGGSYVVNFWNLSYMVVVILKIQNLHFCASKNREKNLDVDIV